jgi:glutathione S-transferase
MLELYQFELSHYCEKVRFVLDYKGLPYRKIEVVPGLGQWDLYRLSGQRQVPVLRDGATVIADSTAIVRHLEQQYPDRPVIPTDSPQQGLCWLLEEWADASLGVKGRIALLGSLGKNPALAKALIPEQTPPALRQPLEGWMDSWLAPRPGGFGADWLPWLGAGLGLETPDQVLADLRQDLSALCQILKEQPFLVTDSPTLADFAVAGLSLYLKFPQTPALKIPPALQGQGIPGVADDPQFESFFAWRDRLYGNYRVHHTHHG